MTETNAPAYKPLTHEDWGKRIDQVLSGDVPFLGHTLRPIPLRNNPAKTEKVAVYMELELLKFFEEYSARSGAGSLSAVIRRLAIIGALAEGYKFNEEGA